MSRPDAVAHGKITYHGSPCVHGHLGLRYTLSRACVECVKSQASAFRKRDRARIKQIREELSVNG